jgi:hypothetical protein
MLLVCEIPQPLACATLYSMQLQLSGLQELALAAHNAEGWQNAEGAHRELGGLTQLTKLCLDLQHISVSGPW